MAKKTNTPAATDPSTDSATPRKPASARVKERDAKTQKKIEDLAISIVKRTLSGREPIVEIPLRTKSNTTWNKKKGILEMGWRR